MDRPHLRFVSHFNCLEHISVIRRIETPVERLIDHALSMSATSPEKHVTERETLMTKLRGTLECDARDRIIIEIVKAEALLGFRSLPV